jgi:hypothetical protein
MDYLTDYPPHIGLQLWLVWDWELLSDVYNLKIMVRSWIA